MNSGRPGPLTNSPYGWGGAPVQPTAPPFDAELGQIFIRMRTLLGLGLWDMARAVGSEPMVIADLEAGAVGALPPWPEVNRLVGAYAQLAGIDPHPILTRMQLSLTARGPGAPMPPAYQAAPQPYAGAPGYYPSATNRQISSGATERIITAQPIPRASSPNISTRAVPATNRSNTSAMPRVEKTRTTIAQKLIRPLTSVGRGVARGFSYRAQTILIIALFAVVPATVAIIARVSPGLLYAILQPVPAAMRQPLRLVVDWTVGALAPVRDGLTWIDVDDPQIRKSARLPGKAPAPSR